MLRQCPEDYGGSSSLGLYPIPPSSTDLVGLTYKEDGESLIPHQVSVCLRLWSLRQAQTKKRIAKHSSDSPGPKKAIRYANLHRLKQTIMRIYVHCPSHEKNASHNSTQQSSSSSSSRLTVLGREQWAHTKWHLQRTHVQMWCREKEFVAVCDPNTMRPQSLDKGLPQGHEVPSAWKAKNPCRFAGWWKSGGVRASDCFLGPSPTPACSQAGSLGLGVPPPLTPAASWSSTARKQI